MNLFCIGQRKTTEKYKDGYLRTFKGIPKMNKEVKGLVSEYIEAKEYKKAILFFMGHCGYDRDYSVFLVREFIKGNI